MWTKNGETGAGGHWEERALWWQLASSSLRDVLTLRPQRPAQMALCASQVWPRVRS